jgi:hypothetical protein
MRAALEGLPRLSQLDTAGDWTYTPGHGTETEVARGHRERRGTERVSRTTAHLALGLLNSHKDGAIFEDPHIAGGFRDDDGNSLCH